MATPKDPTLLWCKKAATFPGAVQGTSCNQTSFRIGKDAFLFIGPGAKGQGFKAMLKLERSKAQAQALAAKEPERYSAGSGVWITLRFSAEKPIPRIVWEKWLKESFEIVARSPAKKVAKKKTTKKAAKKTKKKATRKVAKKKASRKKSAKRG